MNELNYEVNEAEVEIYQTSVAMTGVLICYLAVADCKDPEGWVSELPLSEWNSAEMDWEQKKEILYLLTEWGVLESKRAPDPNNGSVVVTHWRIPISS